MPGILSPFMSGPMGPQASPQSGFGSLFGGDNWLARTQRENPEVLLALGSGLMNGNLSQGFANAAPLMAAGRQKNATKQYLIRKGLSPEDADIVAQNPALLSDMLKGDDIVSAGKGRLYNKTKNTWISDPSLGPEGQVDYSQIPQYFRKKDGSYGIGVLGDNGTFKEVDLGGAEPLGPMGTSLDKAFGHDMGEAKANLYRMSSNLPGLTKTVEQLTQLSDAATYTPGGQAIDTARRWLDMDPREAAVARTKYMAIVDNQILPLLRETFGAAFTVQEGESLRATLGAPEKTPTEKKAVLDAFIEQKKRNIEAMASQLNIPTEQLPGGDALAPPPSGGGKTSTGIPWSLSP